ncbi:hypothetical protein LV779_02180 [Streptomyces thinghirensis]|nr:hypothetical protein [Streptomyces thinghirensis]
MTVREYGTRYLRITVRYHGDAGFSWLRTPGPAHTRPQRLPPWRSARHCGASTPPSVPRREGRCGARLALGEWAAGPEPDRAARPGVRYRVPGAVSVARLLPSGDDTAFRLSVSALADAGRTLRRLHREPWAFPERPPHPGMRRLRAWILGEETGPDATRLRAHARSRLGPLAVGTADGLVRGRERTVRRGRRGPAARCAQHRLAGPLAGRRPRWPCSPARRSPGATRPSTSAGS